MQIIRTVHQMHFKCNTRKYEGIYTGFLQLMRLNGENNTELNLKVSGKREQTSAILKRHLDINLYVCTVCVCSNRLNSFSPWLLFPIFIYNHYEDIYGKFS